MNENQLTIVKGYELDRPLIQKIDSLIDNCYRDCLGKYLNLNVNTLLNLQISQK